MYETKGSMPMAKSCEEPDWEEVYKLRKEELEKIGDFKVSLLEFIGVVGTHSLRRDRNFLAELLGTVEIDIIERDKELNRILEKMEK